MPSSTDRATKQRRLAELRSASGASALLLTSHEAVSWYLDGARVHVSLAGPPVVAVRVDDDGDTLYVAANEADRLIEEELLPEDAARVVRVPWQTPPSEADPGDAIGEAAYLHELRAARASLLPGEQARYRALGAESARIMTDVAMDLRPEASERAAAAMLSERLTAAGIDPLVILVAGESRTRHRHPLPTDDQLGRRAMMVVCGRRNGVIANLTRWIGRAGRDDAKILEVEAAFLRATQPGSSLAEAFHAGCAAYATSGFDPDEWRKHHQGGPTGYAGRDPRATGAVTEQVHADQAFAWNPSAPGAKVEDTVIVGSGVEVLTVDPRWPTDLCDGRSRPAAREYGS